ncbi:MAG: HAD-IIIC family phosphatase [Candidatus Binatia bacterium]
MLNDQLDPMNAERTIAITATFTAEPLERPLTFWLEELQIPARITFAPYNQVFQQLVDPSSLLSTNRTGVNIILVNFEDWQKSDAGRRAAEGSFPALERDARDFARAVTAAAERAATPQFVCLCPASPAVEMDPDRKRFFEDIAASLQAELQEIPGVHVISPAELFACYPVAEYHDPHTDSLTHIPYTPLFFSALATMLARKIHSLTSNPYKVIVLDCDHTLWGGVCGEDGARGIEITPPWKNIQEFLLEQYHAGMLLCLCSKNNEADVVEVFSNRSDMPLKLEHFVARRINWRQKSENIRALAQELNLGADSFIFLDDDPVECAEVQSHCPEVLTFQVPRDPEQAGRFLSHLWIFDHLKVTTEGQQRNLAYKQSSERTSFHNASLSFKDFLAGLDLAIEVAPLVPHQIPRVAELTQRTNQFNFTTQRRTESDIQRLYQGHDAECLIVNLRDRFGDYGLVGVIIFTAVDGIFVDTFLLSCRALGKGVEHRLLARLGEIARQRGLSRVDVRYLQTKKSRPALEFLEIVGADLKETIDGGFLFKFPAVYAAAIEYRPPEAAIITATSAQGEAPSVISPESTDAREKASLLSSIAIELSDAERIHRVVLQTRRPQPREVVPFMPPRSPLEYRLAHMWSELLGLERIGVDDNFFDLGGHSLLGMQVLSRIRKDLGVELPVRLFFTTKLTIGGLCREILMAQADAASVDELDAVLKKIEGLSDDQVESLLVRNDQSQD